VLEASDNNEDVQGTSEAEEDTVLTESPQRISKCLWGGGGEIEGTFDPTFSQASSLVGFKH